MLRNPYFNRDQHIICPEAPFPSVNAEAPLALLARCPHYQETPLLNKVINGNEFFIKDERERMGLGSFKALGAAYVIARMTKENPNHEFVFVTASAGNHGLSVAAGAKIFGCKAVIYLADTVPEYFVQKLRDYDAQVIREGDSYEAAMAAAAKAADHKGWVLLSDSAWEGYTALPHQVMEGYLVMAAEITQQIPQPPTHIFLQAGVGGMAAAAAAYFRKTWGDEPSIYVVEPSSAPAIYNAVEGGQFTTTKGPVSAMGRLDCKEASLIALNGLARDADGFLLLDDDDVLSQLTMLASLGLSTSASGGAGIVAALLSEIDLPPEARILTILSEGA